MNCLQKVKSIKISKNNLTCLITTNYKRNSTNFEFKNNGILETDRNGENCNDGPYTLEENDQIYLLFDCTDFLFSIEEKTTTSLELNSRADDGGVIYKFKRLE